MKTRTLSLAVMAGLLGTAILAPTSAQAQQVPRLNIGQLVSSLLSVNINDVDITVVDGDLVVTIGDVLTDVVDITDSLNNNDIRILENILNRSPILSNNSNFLNDLLRDAEIITDNQVVVGVLGGAIQVITLP